MTIKNRLHNNQMIMKTILLFMYSPCGWLFLLNLYNFILYNSSNQIIYFNAIG